MYVSEENVGGDYPTVTEKLVCLDIVSGCGGLSEDKIGAAKQRTPLS